MSDLVFYNEREGMYYYAGFPCCDICDKDQETSIFLFRELTQSSYRLVCPHCIQEAKNQTLIIKGFEIFLAHVNPDIQANECSLVVPFPIQYQPSKTINTCYMSDEDITKDLTEGIELIGADKYMAQKALISHRQALMLQEDKRKRLTYSRLNKPVTDIKQFIKEGDVVGFE